MSRTGQIARDLKKVRNAKPLLSRFGTALGIDARRRRYVAQHALGFSLSRHAEAWQGRLRALKPAAKFKPIAYPKPDGKLTFDRLSSVFLSNTNHEEDQPVHLCCADPNVPVARHSAGLCRAGAALLPGRRLRGRRRRRRRAALSDQRAELRALQDLRHQGPGAEHHWHTPEGGGGPNYSGM